MFLPRCTKRALYGRRYIEPHSRKSFDRIEQWLGIDSADLINDTADILGNCIFLRAFKR